MLNTAEILLTFENKGISMNKGIKSANIIKKNNEERKRAIYFSRD